MADLLKSIAITLDDAHEGGFQDNPNDRANWSSGIIGQGELVGTKYGITALDMPGVVIRDITESMAVSFYLKRFCSDLYYKIAFQPLADKLFDMGVLFGVGEAVRTMQIVLGVEPTDGEFGPITLKAMNTAEPISLVRAYQAGLVTHAIAIATARPVDRDFLQDWIRRINS